MTVESRIPEISDEQLHSLFRTIKPVVEHDGDLWYIEDVNLRTTAFTWDPKPTERADGLVPLGTVVTFHTYGAPALFKPSIAEVLAQMPGEWASQARAFRIDTSVLDRHSIVDSYHAVPTIFYRIGGGEHR